MKKLFLMLFIAAFASTAVIAQNQPNETVQKEEKAKQEKAEWEKKLKDELKLTTEQIAKYDAISKEYNDKIDVILKDASLDKDAQKEQKTALKKEKEAKFLLILTPEQQLRYKQIMEEKKKGMKQGS